MNRFFSDEQQVTQHPGRHHRASNHGTHWHQLLSEFDLTDSTNEYFKARNFTKATNILQGIIRKEMNKSFTGKARLGLLSYLYHVTSNQQRLDVPSEGILYSHDEYCLFVVLLLHNTYAVLISCQFQYMLINLRFSISKPVHKLDFKSWSSVGKVAV